MKKVLFVVLGIGLCHLSSAQGPLFESPKKLGSSINSKQEEGKVLVSEDGKLLFFVRTTEGEDKTNDMPVRDIWYSEKEANGSWRAASNNDLGALNDENNNAIIGVSRDGARIYLANTNKSKRKKRKAIRFSDLESGQWKEPGDLGLSVKVKGDAYDFNMSVDEDVLLVSMVGNQSLGEEDLYVILKNDKGKWGKPIHLGATVNTDSSEVSPFLSEDKTVLYFASKGHPGYGDADIFVTERQDDTWKNWSVPVNLGDKINTKSFEGSFSVINEKEMYFVSNRDGGQGDIYFSRVVDDGYESNTVIEEEAETITVDIETSLGTEGGVTVDSLNINQESGQLETIIVLFNFDSFQVLPLFLDKLNNLATFLNSQVGLKINLIGHTDSVGPAAYNQKLSVRRAEAVKKYLLNKGVDEDEIILTGEGEARPITSNETPEGRYQNRRVEVSLVVAEEEEE